MNKTSRRFSVKLENGLYSKEDFIKDCPNHEFIPLTLDAVKRIIAIGDIHGDFDLAVRSFKLADLIDDQFNWIANPPNTIVVQVGDQIDSCRPIPGVYDCHQKRPPDDRADDMKILKFFNDMHQKASQVGGAVYSLLGNHELMNVEGRFGYVSYDNFYNYEYESEDGTKYTGPKGRKDAFQRGGPIASMLACTRPSVLIIGSTMFIHAGILPILARRLDFLNLDNRTKLKYLNAIVRRWLLKKISENSDVQSSRLLINNDKLSPFWTRIYGLIPENAGLESQSCDDVQKILKILNSENVNLEVFKIGQIVVGHTPQLYTNQKGINGTCYGKDGKNRLYRIDGGFAQAFSIFDNKHMVQVLEILDDKIFNILTETTLDPFRKPELAINEDQMREVSKIYSQNRPKDKNYQN